MQIEGNVALVTGGASGLGEATARHLHARGASVLIFDRDAERAAAIVAELGPRAEFVAGDATTDTDTQAAMDAAAELGALRIVVACAGGGTKSIRTVQRDGSPHPLADFRATVELNLYSAFNAVSLGGAAMAKLEPVDEDGARGVIITTASIAGFEGQIGQISYGSAKAGIIGMTLIAARDLAAIGVRVNSIAPGTIATRAWDGAPASIREPLEAKVPFPRRFGHAQEFADLVEHIAVNRYLNGQVIRLDGAVRFDPK
jgi:NAD(P)-dependent dehydrogenase (short-subunit alcohol dehydrogenase family)